MYEELRGCASQTIFSDDREAEDEMDIEESNEEDSQSFLT